MRVKIHILFITFLTVLLSCSNDQKRDVVCPSSDLKFNDKGEFKIAQITDIHWSENASNNDSTIAVIKNVLDTEHPDLVILSGDIVCYEPVKEGWLSISKIFSESQIPWLVLMGNHDAEQAMTREEIYTLLKEQEYFITGIPIEDKCNIGDFILPVKASNEPKDAAVIYCFDSNDYPENTLLNGKYDWIHINQIEWYRKYSRTFTANNAGKALPSLAYFHIPIPEYKSLITEKGYYGMANEGNVSSPEINSGFFASLVEMGDVMGTFVGHDHDNSFIGQQHGVAMGYGRVSGLNAYGTLERGARIVKLYEGKRQFDTWIRTNSGRSELYYYPSGITDDDEKSMKYLDATELENPVQGVKYKYFEYEGKIKSVEMLADKSISTLKQEGYLKNFLLDPAKREDYFGLEFETYIKIPQDAIYQFYTYTDDGSVLYIDDHLVVDNDGSHSAALADGMIALKKGYHKLKLKYFESYMGEYLEVGICSRYMMKTVVPDDMLYVVK